MRSNFVKRSKKKIAIYGMGSTRLAIALANYYCSYLKKRVALGEVGSGHLTDVSSDTLRSDKVHLCDNLLIGFTRMGVDYYPYINMDETMKLVNEDYDTVIWDFVDISHDYMNLYRMCDVRLFLYNIAPYNRRKFCRIINLFERDTIEVDFMCYLLNQQDLEWYCKTVGRSRCLSDIHKIPFIANPNKLTREDIVFFESRLSLI